MNRRSFVTASTGALAAGVLPSRAAPAAGKLQIGLDHFAVRATGWKAPQLIDYAASLKLDVLFLSELGPFESFEDSYLRKLKAQADAAGLKLYTGGMSICRTARRYKPEQGTPEEYIALLIRIAKACGSPVARCVLGDASDRASEGGIERNIEECVKVLRTVKNRCETEGVMISIENHAGDMRSDELKMLIEAAGKGHVGANIDPGNAVWAMEDPMQHLEVLGPYVNCSSVRDSMVWEDENGAVAQWTAIGEGLVDFKQYAKRFAELAPGAPMNIETISGFAKPISFLKPDYMKPYPKVGEAGLAGFRSLAKRGHKIEPFKAPEGPGKKDAEIAYQKAQFEKSVKWLRENA